MKNAVLAMAFIAIGSTASHAQEIRIGTEGAYPPWSMADANGNVSGFDADTAKLLCEKMQAKCRIVVIEFSGLIPALNANRIDAIISGMLRTPQRMKAIGFSTGYADLVNYWIIPKDSPVAIANTLDEVLTLTKGKRIGVQVGTAQAGYAVAKFTNSEVKSYDSLDQMQIDLAAGRLDAGFADLSAAGDFIRKNPDFVVSKVKILGADAPDLLGDGVGVGLRKDSGELKAKIDKGLCAIMADGSLSKASETWFKSDITRRCST